MKKKLVRQQRGLAHVYAVMHARMSERRGEPNWQLRLLYPKKGAPASYHGQKKYLHTPMARFANIRID